MNTEKQAALEAAGFRVGDAEDFLELTEEERRCVRLRVANAVREVMADPGHRKALDYLARND